MSTIDPGNAVRMVSVRADAARKAEVAGRAPCREVAHGPECSGECAPLPGEVLVIDMQDRRPPVLRGNHVHTCPECSTHVPCKDACGCFEDMRLEDGTERGGFVVCEECKAYGYGREMVAGEWAEPLADDEPGGEP